MENCDYCKGFTNNDSRGNCSACGAGREHRGEADREQASFVAIKFADASLSTSAYFERDLTALSERMYFGMRGTRNAFAVPFLGSE